MTKGERTYVRDRPYSSATTSLFEEKKMSVFKYGQKYEILSLLSDEYHLSDFFFVCDSYENLRPIYLKDSWLLYRSLNLFYSIMSVNEKANILE